LGLVGPFWHISPPAGYALFPYWHLPSLASTL
jgi:hypothetical protein